MGAQKLVAACQTIPAINALELLHLLARSKASERPRRDKLESN